MITTSVTMGGFDAISDKRKSLDGPWVNGRARNHTVYQRPLLQRAASAYSRRHCGHRGHLMTKLNVNGKSVDVDVDPETPLLWVLRDTLGLTGTKFGCGMALCGACTVHLAGEPIRSCRTPISAVGDKPVTTIEGL